VRLARNAGHQAGVVVVSGNVDGSPLGGLRWPGVWIVTAQRQEPGCLALPAPCDAPASEPEVAASVGGDIDRWGQGRFAAGIDGYRPAYSGGIGEIQVDLMAGPAGALHYRPLWWVADKVEVPPMQVRRQFGAVGQIYDYSRAWRSYR